MNRLFNSEKDFSPLVHHWQLFLFMLVWKYPLQFVEGLLYYCHKVSIPLTQPTLSKEMLVGGVEAFSSLTFSHGPQNFQSDQILLRVDNTGHTSRGDEGPAVQSFLSQLEPWEQVKAEKPAIRFPPPGFVMGKWKSHHT